MPAGLWACHRCTLDNTADSARCEACEEPRRERSPQTELADTVLSGNPLLHEFLGGHGLFSGGLPISAPEALLSVLGNSLQGPAGRGLFGGGLPSTGPEAFLNAVGNSLRGPAGRGLFGGGLPSSAPEALLEGLGNSLLGAAPGVDEVLGQAYGPARRPARLRPSPMGMAPMRAPDGPARRHTPDEDDPLFDPEIPEAVLRIMAGFEDDASGDETAAGATQDDPWFDSEIPEAVLQMIAGLDDNASGDEPAAGAAQASIRSLPTRRITIGDVAGMPIEHKACAVCMEDFKAGDEQKSLPCFHRFHGVCIDPWLRRNSSCPICKHCIDEHGGPELAS